ncbi:Fc receptor-like protein 5 [Clarias gariepinus]|uniref:Fc receptor-like protein 5 n=1 Tax=Clarias gariepinus TaxID=13013 RepID=UPI00234C73B7|nr:Fc receptor-like protein 5 [Clarias gariepinus]
MTPAAVAAQHPQGRKPELLGRCWSPKPVVSIHPETHVYGGERVTLRCDIQGGGGDTEWTYSWYRNSDRLGPRRPYGDYSYSTNQWYRIWHVIDSDSGDYTCRGWSKNSQISETSDAVKLTVSERPEVVLSVSPQSWLTEGDSVTLNCGVTGFSTDWRLTWYTVNPYREIRDSHGDYVSGRSYTINPVARNHTGVYQCSAARYNLHFTLPSNLQPLWITGESPPVSLIINPNRTQHFTGDSLSLSCEDQSNSTGWTVRQYTESERVLDCSSWGSVTGSTCNISSLSTSYTGVYWCESESKTSNPVNITVHVSPKAVVSIDPDTLVYRGETGVELRCNIQRRGDTEWTYSWYKNNDSLGPHIGSRGYISIWSVTDSDSGDYICRGQSKDSCISEISDAVTLTVSAERPEVVLSVSPQSWLTEGDSVTLNCGVTDSSTGWRFTWYTVNPNRRIRDSHGDYVSGRSYTISPVAHLEN